MPDAYLGLGSNVEPGLHLRRALATLVERFGNVRCSSVYRSPAAGRAAPDYWNTVAKLTATRGARDLLAQCRELEQGAGRRRPSRIVSLDVDLLLYGARVDPAYRIPRDDLLGTPFVLGPLAELAPELAHPVTGARIGDAWRALARQQPKVVRLGTLDDALGSG
jgi:2-amino-4-hydroxy-6-hydroxymethyldihydropteridine diphosphokinase